MAEDDSTRDQIIAAYIARAAALIDEAREIMEDVASLVLRKQGFIPTVFESSPEPEDPCESKKDSES